MKKMLVILGPTATGKTDLAILLARKLDGELVACDSRQVYKGLDIGTGKLPGKKAQTIKGEGWWKINKIKIWMYDVVEPNTLYAAFDYIQKARQIIEEILDRGKLPIIVGGTGLYLKGLLEGLDNLQIPVDRNLRQELGKLSLKDLQSRVATLSPIRWEKLNDSERKNPRRLIRIIEHVVMYGYINKNINVVGLAAAGNVLKVGLTAPRPILNQRIDLRLDDRLDQGLISEGQRFLKSGVSLDRMRQLGLEYGCLADFLEKKITKEQFVQNLKVKIHQYAKRQMTWFRKEKNVVWFDITTADWSYRLEKKVLSWYNN